MYTVYKHTSPDGKVYIGITGQKPEKRWDNGNGYKQNKHLYNAIRKYGWENFRHEIVCTGLSKWQACRVEQSLIKYFDSTNPDKGYNHSIGGECGTLGVHPSAETLRKLSEVRKGRHLSAETRRKISEARKGIHLSAETRRKLSEANKGANSPRYGKHQSAEARRKISEARKGMHFSAETRRKISEVQKGRIPWNRKAVICVETGAAYCSGTEAAKAIGVTQGAICSVLRGATKTSGGYHWKYAD